MTERRRQNERLSIRLLDAWAEAWREPALRAAKVVENRRLSTTVARCRVREAVIELSRAALDLPAEEFSEVLCHEAAHLAAHRRHGRIRPHGPEWATLVVEAGFVPRATLPADSTHASSVRRRRSAAYEHRCPVCRRARVARTAARRWLCALCVAGGLSGELRITRIDA